jgi:hypothetical protein
MTDANQEWNQIGVFDPVLGEQPFQGFYKGNAVTYHPNYYRKVGGYIFITASGDGSYNNDN